MLCSLSPSPVARYRLLSDRIAWAPGRSEGTCFEWCSAAREVRPTLLGEGPYRFLVVPGKIRLRLKSEAQVHDRKLTQPDVDGLLGPAYRPHRAAGECRA